MHNRVHSGRIRGAFYVCQKTKHSTEGFCMFENGRILTVFFAMLLVCLAPQLTQAATYYVDKSGDDSNSCTTAQDTAPERAKQSITNALGCPSPGDTIIV